MGNFSDFLFARPSFLEGMARIVDVRGVLNTYNTAASAQEADAIAMLADWSAVGQSIWDAIAVERSAQEAAIVKEKQ